ncbi:hypothetical protein [Streptomyces sp. NPDC053720]|uniref:hypothetical protein n=1 Tax=Streptomyces sp. NPDC053720 TaxID=3154855 RepID=UPI00343040F7
MPTRLPCGRSALIRDALIDAPGRARRKTAGVLRRNYGTSPHRTALTRVLGEVLDTFCTGRTPDVAEASTSAS